MCCSTSTMLERIVVDWNREAVAIGRVNPPYFNSLTRLSNRGKSPGDFSF